MSYGLSASEIRHIIQDELDKKPDLKYYIDNDYICELVDTLVDGISNAIEKNTESVIKEITRELRRR